MVHPYASLRGSRLLRAARSVARPRLKVLLAALRSTLRDGADRRHPSGSADFRFGSGWGPRGAARHDAPSLGRSRTRKVMNSIESVPVAPARVFKALSSDDLRRCAPSVFAEHARPSVSSRYTFVSTQQVVALLGAEGWEPVKASEQRVRLEDRIGFQMHEIRFARRVDLEAGAFQVGNTRPEMILQNAHDGSRAYRIDAGLYRLVCRNGLTVADTDFAHVSIRHMDVSADAFANSGAADSSRSRFTRPPAGIILAGVITSESLTKSGRVSRAIRSRC